MKFSVWLKGVAAGVVAYHGNRSGDLTRFERSPHPFFATTSKKLACYYGNFVYKVAFSLRNPFVFDAKGSSWLDLEVPDEGRHSTDSLGLWARDKGHDGVVAYNVLEGNYPIESTVYLVFDASVVSVLGSAKVHELRGGGVKNRLVDWDTDSLKRHEKQDSEILALAFPEIPHKAF